jgi:hypothetical protein
MNKRMKWSRFKVPVKVKQINEYLFSDSMIPITKGLRDMSNDSTDHFYSIYHVLNMAARHAISYQNPIENHWQVRTSHSSFNMRTQVKKTNDLAPDMIHEARLGGKPEMSIEGQTA